MRVRPPRGEPTFTFGEGNQLCPRTWRGWTGRVHSQQKGIGGHLLLLDAAGLFQRRDGPVEFRDECL